MGIAKDDWEKFKGDMRDHQRDMIDRLARIETKQEDLKPRCESHGKAIDSLKTSRNILYGGYLTLVGYFTLKKNL